MITTRIRNHGVRAGHQTGAAADQPLTGPASLHWRYAGDNRILLLQVKAAMLQLMHPALGAGVEQHSKFYGDSFTGLTAAVPAIQGLTYDWPHSERTAREIRDRHWQVKGVDAHGDRYHALAPLTYFWGHATMFDMMVSAIEIFDHPLSRAEKERLYQESMAAFRLYGISDRPLPQDWASFRAHFDTVCSELLELTPAAAALLRFHNVPPAELGAVPKPLYGLFKAPLGRLLWWLGLGTLPPAVRASVGTTWSRRDQRRLARIGRCVAFGWRLLPWRLRYSGRAQAGIRRAAGAPR